MQVIHNETEHKMIHGYISKTYYLSTKHSFFSPEELIIDYTIYTIQYREPKSVIIIKL